MQKELEEMKGSSNTGREAAEGQKVSPRLLASGRKLEKLEDVEEFKLRRKKRDRKTNSS